MERAELTPVHFNLPEDFDLHEHLAKSFGVYHGEGDVHVKVRFSSAVARYVTDSNWHTSQILTKENDGTLVAEFTLSDNTEIKSWILSFGKHAEVVEPAALRQEVAEEIETILRAYKASTRQGIEPT